MGVLVTVVRRILARVCMALCVLTLLALAAFHVGVAYSNIDATALRLLATYGWHYLAFVMAAGVFYAAAKLVDGGKL